MGRSRSPLQTLIIAWIALKVIGALLGVSLFVATTSNVHANAHASLELVRVFGYASTALLALIVLVLVIDRRYAIAACVVAVVVVLSIASSAGTLTLGRAAGTPLTGTLRSPSRALHSVSGALASVTSTQAARRTQSDAVATTVRRFFGEVDGPRAAASRARQSALRGACRRVTLLAQAQLARRFGGAAGGLRSRCGVALERAVAAGAFGRPAGGATAIARRIWVSRDLRSASYYASATVRLDLIQTYTGWMISSFGGRAFARR
jgi:hypothetical protein